MLLSPVNVDASADLKTIIDRYTVWRGGIAFEHLSSIRESNTLDSGGLHGTEKILTARDGRSRVDLDLGPLKQIQAVTPDGAWEVTPAAQVQSMALIDTLSLRRSAALQFADALRGRGGAKVELAAPTTDSGRTWATVRVTFGDDDIYDVLVDPVSGELGGIRVTAERQLQIERFSDWRPVDGVRMPFLKTIEGAVPSDNETHRVITMNINEPAGPGSFTRPSFIRKTAFTGCASSTGWLHFEFYDGNRMFIPARINGHDTLALLDSGATVSTIDNDYAKQIGISAAGRVTAGGTGGLDTAGFAGDVDVEVGNLKIAGLTVASLDLKPIARRIGHPMPFVLGDELFNELVVDIDFPHRLIAFRDPTGIAPPSGAATVPLRRLIGNRSVPVSVEGAPPVEFEFDLGNGSPMEIYPAYYQPRQLLAGRKSSEVLGGAVGGFHPEIIATLRRIEFAGVTLNDVPASFTRDVVSASNSNRVVGNLGLPVLARFRLLIDYPQDRLYAVPLADAGSSAFHKDRLGLSMSGENGVLMVQFVSPGSPAQAAGFKAGDQIAALNGEAAALWTDDRVAVFRDNSGTAPITFLMLDGSTRRVRPKAFY
ncbi:retropepsin-like aspartic protease [Glacieibacterium megasporae]|uniref:retropepsin-like aspartic protease n=1 Tax=Glacieibacterium megasporae TaxID=2835787 RepID=UPI001CAA6C1E|nr:aspartyl protease family protein [Polymorphobacter megasporae]UAJ12239.1 aspartyl protease family protein [Polymorphobacter megasporae]